VNEEKDYAGIVQVAEVDAPELDESMPVREILHHADAALLPSMTVKEAIAIFEVEAEALAVVQSPERRRVVGLLSESHALRRYAEELELRLRERPPAAPEARSELELGYSPITFASACGMQGGTGVIDRWRSARTSHLHGSAEEPVERRRGRCCRLLPRATERDGNLALSPLRLPSCCSRFPVDRMTAPAVTHRRATPPRLPQGSAPPSKSAWAQAPAPLSSGNEETAADQFAEILVAIIHRLERMVGGRLPPTRMAGPRLPFITGLYPHCGCFWRPVAPPSS